MNSESPQSRMRKYIQMVATGPELSKSLDRDQARDGVAMILQGEVDAVRAGIFLIALRMKRETDDENIGALEALQDSMEQRVAKASRVVAIADPFNGYLRGMPATPFLPPVLAACGLPSYMHGLEAVGPKYGITANQVLESAGKRIDLDPDEAVACLDDPGIGWCYLDQASYQPGLHDLVELRDIMVKRSCLSTLEVVLKPLSGAESTYLMTGFVHKAYPPVYASLARHAGFESAAIVRGVEGGCIPSLSQVSRYFGYAGKSDLEMFKLSPKTCGINQEQRAAPIAENLKDAVEQSSLDNRGVLQPVIDELVDSALAALENQPGPLLDSLVYGGAIALRQFCGLDLEAASARVRSEIASGAAKERFDAAP